MKKNINVSKINQLVIRGLIAEDQELFLNRLGIIIDRSSRELLEQLADGIIISARITDAEAAKAWIAGQNRGNNWTITEIISVEPISDPNCVRINYRYKRPSKWFATEEKADRYSRGYSEDGVNEMDEQHQYEGSCSFTSNDTCRIDKEWLEVEML
jgi:hypothetical protein